MRSTLLGAVLTLGGVAGALAPVLTPQQIQLATREGDTMFHTSGAYAWGPYLLKTYTEDVILKSNSPEVDGIALGTPYERVRYESFLASFQDMPLTPAQSTSLARSLRNKVTFLLYTHSPRGVEEEEEQWQQAYNQGKVRASSTREHSYLDEYQAATLTVGGRVVKAQPQLDGPFRDQFTLPTGNAQFRFLGVVKYTFDLSGLPTTGTATLRFRDSQGKAYTQQADLSKVR